MKNPTVLLVLTAGIALASILATVGLIASGPRQWFVLVMQIVPLVTLWRERRHHVERVRVDVVPLFRDRPRRQAINRKASGEEPPLFDHTHFGRPP
jgi:hypothetical protein